ncbi:MAG: acetylornithine/N-succinyldiaminopimelate aminotransferase [Actinomycetota bacterium]|nr:acetylornithine/N-succinyldiaminopimelate aminotransferase [Actinomycetota bacterium]
MAPVTGGTQAVLDRWRGTIADTYGTPAMVLVRGRGAEVWDVEGNRYLDLLAGIAVNALGHAHPAVIEAVTTQLGTLGHTSNLAATIPGIALAEQLLGLAGRPGRVFFANSGAEANEAAFKLSRLTGRTTIVAAEGSFHGRTAAALSLTGQPAKRAPFEPLVPGVAFVPYGDAAAIAAVVDESVAAVVLEPIQGEGGVVMPPDGYLMAVQQACRRVGALFILDEVQTGIGRTGSWFAYQREPALAPDAITLAKGLGGGLPIGALVAFGDAGDLWGPGMHGSTFGGNPVSCAAALAVLQVIKEQGLADHAVAVGGYLRECLAATPGVVAVRGAGLLLGVVLAPDVDAKAVEVQARTHGVIVNAIGASVIRLAPPLNLTLDQADEAMAVLNAVIRRLGAGVAG